VHADANLPTGNSLCSNTRFCNPPLDLLPLSDIKKDCRTNKEQAIAFDESYSPGTTLTFGTDPIA